MSKNDHETMAAIENTNTSLIDQNEKPKTTTQKTQNKNIQIELLDNLNSYNTASIKEIDTHLTKIQAKTTKKTGPKVFCIILTRAENLHRKASATYDTWAHKCDNHRYITLIREQQSSPVRAEFRLENSLILLKPEKLIREDYKRLTDKVFAAYEDVFRHQSQYDWYLKCDDDTFIFMDNLRSFLSDKDPNQAVSYGYHFQAEGEFLSGGAGYVMSREAFTRLGKQLSQNSAACPNDGKEDVNTFGCLRQLGAVIGDSTDDLGRERFHPFSIETHWRGFEPGHFMHYFPKHPVRKVN
jgi:glycoprotein-N-acetylgalactosamine 3-beta-galactosyltransferase